MFVLVVFIDCKAGEALYVKGFLLAEQLILLFHYLPAKALTSDKIRLFIEAYAEGDLLVNKNLKERLEISTSLKLPFNFAKKISTIFYKLS